MSKQRWAVASAIVGLFSAWAILTAMPPRALAQDTPPAVPDAVAQPVTFSIDGPTQRLEMVVATSRILTLEHKIPRLLVANPEVVKATPISPNQVQLSAVKPGVTQLNVWDEGQASLHRRCRRDSGRAGTADADQVRVPGRRGAGAAVGQQRLPHGIRSESVHGQQHRADRGGLLPEGREQHDDRRRAADPAEDQSDGSVTHETATSRF